MMIDRPLSLFTKSNIPMPARPINDNANQGRNPLHTEGELFTVSIPIPIGWEVKDGIFLKYYSTGPFRFIGIDDITLYYIRKGSRHVSFTVLDKNEQPHVITFFHLLVAEPPKIR